MKYLATLVLLLASTCGAQQINHNPMLITAADLSGGIATNYPDRVETDIKYAKQLRDLGYLGASIDVLIEAMDGMRERFRVQPVVNDDPWDDTWGLISLIADRLKVIEDYCYTKQPIVITNVVTQACTRAHCPDCSTLVTNYVPWVTPNWPWTNSRMILLDCNVGPSATLMIGTNYVHGVWTNFGYVFGAAENNPQPDRTWITNRQDVYIGVEMPFESSTLPPEKSDRPTRWYRDGEAIRTYPVNEVGQ